MISMRLTPATVALLDRLVELAKRQEPTRRHSRATVIAALVAAASVSSTTNKQAKGKRQ